MTTENGSGEGLPWIIRQIVAGDTEDDLHSPNDTPQSLQAEFSALREQIPLDRDSVVKLLLRTASLRHADWDHADLLPFVQALGELGDSRLIALVASRDPQSPEHHLKEVRDIVTLAQEAFLEILKEIEETRSSRGEHPATFQNHPMRPTIVAWFRNPEHQMLPTGGARGLCLLADMLERNPV